MLSRRAQHSFSYSVQQLVIYNGNQQCHDSQVYIYIDERFVKRHAFAIKCTKEPYLLRCVTLQLNISVFFSLLCKIFRTMPPSVSWYPSHIDYCHLERRANIGERTRIDRFPIAQYGRFLFRVLPIN